VLAALTPLAAPPGAAASGRLVRVGAAPRLSPGTVTLGSVPATAHLHVDLQLSPRNPAALARYATAVSTPGSPWYRRYLARGQFASVFGPSIAMVRAVTSWLAARGVTVAALSANRLTLQLTASAATFDRALGVGLERVRLPGGRVAFANAGAPKLGVRVAPFVQGIVGLDDLVVPHWLGAARARTATVRGRPSHVRPSAGPTACAAAQTTAAQRHAYTAGELAAAYGFTSLYAAGDLGAGIRIALFEQEVNPTSDVAQYQACYGTSAGVSYIQVDGGAGGAKPVGEADEDIEVALGLAPKAHLDVFQAPPTLKGTLDDYTAIVDRDTAEVISTSWGQCEAQTGASLLAAENTVFEQAAVQGQTMISASGDSGSSGCNTKALAEDDPPSQPYVTGVGGTKLTAAGPPPTEVVWNESAHSAGAGGGGVSAAHVMPAYQSTAAASLHVVGPYSSGSPCHAPTKGYCREVPDVSADSDYATGYVTYESGRWESNGGTSAAAPLWAALAALADASRACAGRTIGFANPALYAAAATSYAADFHDVTSGNNDDTNWGNTQGLYPAGPGYDMASGLGTPNAGNLAKTLCSEAKVVVVRTTTALSLKVTSVTLGKEGAEVFTVRVTGRPGDGRPIGSIAVFSVTKTLCSHAVAALTADASVGRCTLGASALRAGKHPDVFAVFDPNVKSSTNARYHYASSRSRPSTLTVTP
jgi:subtilase family serine protease